ncbi:MAG: hypothetical protein ACWGOV_04985 [Acidiferrobacterales bacterium]
MNTIKKIFQFSLTLLLLFNLNSAHAQIYKCQENGKIVFRDKPCKGEGEQFNLGATIENTDPTGTLGDISGSWKDNGQTVNIRDALGILYRDSGLLSIYLIPDRFTASEVQHFQDTGDDSILKQKPVGAHTGFDSYPFINLRIQFRKDDPLSRDSIESASMLAYGPDGEQPALVELDGSQAISTIRYISIFQDIVYGDVNLESDGDHGGISWKISIKAPIYYR